MVGRRSASRTKYGTSRDRCCQDCEKDREQCRDCGSHEAHPRCSLRRDARLLCTADTRGVLHTASYQCLQLE